MAAADVAYEGLQTSSGLNRNPNLTTAQTQQSYLTSSAGSNSYQQEAWYQHNVRGDTSLVGPRPDSWWTGKRPAECPGMRADGTLTSLPLPQTSAGAYTRQGLLDYFDNAWTLTEVLFSGLQGEEAFYRPPYHKLRHPFIFYYAHPAVLTVNKLRVAGVVQPINEELEQVFEVGVDEMSWDDLSKNDAVWPTVAAATEYRRTAYKLIRSVLETYPGIDGDKAITPEDEGAWALLMGFEHERIHIETSSVLMRELPLGLLRRPEAWPRLHPSSCQAGGAGAGGAAGVPVAGKDFPENELVEVAGRTVHLGRGDKVESFGWDNEFGQCDVDVPSFSAMKMLCSNGEFYRFVTSAGYTERRHWTSEGWAWRTFRNVKWPTFWVADGPQGLHQYKLRCLFEVIAMPWSWPVVVNCHEAKAYCNWLAEQMQKPLRLVTEVEYRLMGDASWDDMSRGPSRDQFAVLRGDELAMDSCPCPVNASLGFGSECAVDAFRPASSGFHDATGNVWVWCEDAFCPLPGFKTNRLFDDFSTPCFDNKHSMLMGCSFISTGNEASIHSRFHFRPHFFQHSGFRVVCGRGGWGDKTCAKPFTTDQLNPAQLAMSQSLASRVDSASPAEQKRQLSRWMVHGFAEEEGEAGVPSELQFATGFPRRCSEFVNAMCEQHGVSRKKALVVSCNVGGLCFQLATTFGSVFGIDCSSALIEVASRLKNVGNAEYKRVEYGTVETARTVTLSGVDASRVVFTQDDLSTLSSVSAGSIHVVVIADVGGRSANLKAGLAKLVGGQSVVAPGGLVIHVGSNDYHEDSVPREQWLGGYVNGDGLPVHAADDISAVLGGEFRWVEKQCLPSLLREGAGDFHISLLHANVWKRS